MRLEEVAERLDVSVKAVRRLIHDGQLAAIYPDGRSPRIPWPALAKYEESARTARRASRSSQEAQTGTSSGRKRADRSASQQARLIGASPKDF
jgi:excisionase family DNA binding protein